MAVGLAPHRQFACPYVQAICSSGIRYGDMQVLHRGRDYVRCAGDVNRAPRMLECLVLCEYRASGYVKIEHIVHGPRFGIASLSAFASCERISFEYVDVRKRLRRM